jgi:hypothetical protein
MSVGCLAPIDDADLFGTVATLPSASATVPTPVATTPPMTTPTMTTPPKVAPAPQCVACDGGGCQEQDDVCAAVDPEYAATGCAEGQVLPEGATCFEYPGQQPTQRICDPMGYPACQDVEVVHVQCCSRLD